MAHALLSVGIHGVAQAHTPVSAHRFKRPPLRPPPCFPPVPLRSAATLEMAPTADSSSQDGADSVAVPEWAGMSYDAQYDDIFSKPLNLRRVTPKPDAEAQAQVGGGTWVQVGACGRVLALACVWGGRRVGADAGGSR